MSLFFNSSQHSFAKQALLEIDNLQRSIMSKYVSVSRSSSITSKYINKDKQLNKSNLSLTQSTSQAHSNTPNQSNTPKTEHNYLLLSTTNLSISTLLLSEYQRRAVSLPKLQKPHISRENSPLIYGKPTKFVDFKSNFLKRSQAFQQESLQKKQLRKSQCVFKSPQISQLARRCESAYSNRNVIYNYDYGSTILSSQRAAQLIDLQQSYAKRVERRKWTNKSVYNQKSIANYGKSLSLDGKIEQFMNTQVDDYFRIDKFSNKFYYDDYGNLTPKTYQQYKDSN